MPFEYKIIESSQSTSIFMPVAVPPRYAIVSAPEQSNAGVKFLAVSDFVMMINVFAGTLFASGRV